MKLYVYLIAFALLAGTIGYGIHIVRKASRVDAAEARAEAAEQGRAADMAEVVKRLDESAADRKALNDKMDGITQWAKNLKIPAPAALVQHNEVPSVEGKCDAPTVGLEFVRVWDSASSPVDTHP